jgi:catechol 2,3-dioxygenase-like lactoylglutathione lyase family enzyme
MLDHIGFAVTDLDRARAFYTAALSPLGISVQMEVPAEPTGTRGAALGFGFPGRPFLWIGEGKPEASGLHVALAAPNRATVDAFHRAALRAGGIDNGAPGIRAHYHPNYYGAFVLDPDGHNIEAVCHRAE